MQLWPQLQTLLDGLSDPSGSTASSKLKPTASDTPFGSDAASPPRSTSSTLDDACKHDEDRLAKLRANPSVDAAIRFDSELKCPKLKPQLLALLDGLSQPLKSAAAQSRNGAPSDTTSASEAVTPTSEPPASDATADACKHDEERLAELQAKPSLDEAIRFENEMECLELQPQVLALLDKLIQAPQSAGAQSPNGAPSNTSSASEAVPPTSEPPASEAESATSDDACKQDEERLARLRTTPSSEEAARFAQDLRCETLRPQLTGPDRRVGQPIASALSERLRGRWRTDERDERNAARPTSRRGPRGPHRPRSRAKKKRFPGKSAGFEHDREAPSSADADQVPLVAAAR